MFVQVIEGQCSDADALQRQMEIWGRDLQPGAIGYLGSTGGVTSSGACIMIVRFENEALARQNSDRPEQTAWWQATQECFDGPVTFHETSDVQIMDHGLGDDVHFVQVMEGHVTDVARAHEMEAESDTPLLQLRPDLKGNVTAYFGDEFCSVAYFSTEAAAREGERRMGEQAPPEMAAWDEVMKVDRYLDLPDPWLAGAK